MTTKKGEKEKNEKINQKQQQMHKGENGLDFFLSVRRSLIE
jgi:hypothetical protein